VHFVLSPFHFTRPLRRNVTLAKLQDPIKEFSCYSTSGVTFTQPAINK